MPGEPLRIAGEGVCWQTVLDAMNDVPPPPSPHCVVPRILVPQTSQTYTLSTSNFSFHLDFVVSIGASPSPPCPLPRTQSWSIMNFVILFSMKFDR